MRFQIIQNFEQIKTEKIRYQELIFTQEYRIDQEGNVYSPYLGWHIVTPSILKGSKKGSGGYHRVSLSTTQGRKFLMVHRLMMETFSPAKDSEKLQVNHIDGNKSNNSLKNLEWCTQAENIQHSIKNGLRNNMPKGEQASCVKLSEKDVLEICILLQEKKLSLQQIGERYNVSRHTIFGIKRKKSWKWLTQNYNFD